MKPLIIKNKPEETRTIQGEQLVRTDNNVPLQTGRILWISESVVDHYQRLYDEDPGWFIENNITFVRILSDKDYAAMIRQRYEKYGGEYNSIHISDRIETEKILAEKRKIDDAARIKELKDKKGK